MVEAESTQSNDAPTAPVYDWANVRGFQVLAAAATDPEAPAVDPAPYAGELAKELSVRAARFSQSIDGSIVLASDGLIRWLGDPVARLIAGDDLLKPRAVVLADDALPTEGREAVQARVTLWIAAHVSKILGPLEGLAAPAAVAESVRDLANRIVQALGVLERERVRQQVKNLDQSARSALRKLGVRFGSLYVFVPALLKPGARALCSQLWGLRRGEAGAERLLAFAAEGRTSFAAEAPPLAADTYRVAGFRLCGDRVVRVDIVERLTDLIRAAIPDHMRPGVGSGSEAAGFVVSPQMTSLTGCAGESFASILRSLGYESHRVKKSEYEAAMRRPVAPMTPIEPPVATLSGEASNVADDGDAAPESGNSSAETDAAPENSEGEPEPTTEIAASASVADHTEAAVHDPEPDFVEASEPPALQAISESIPEIAEPLPAEPFAGDSSPIVAETAEPPPAGTKIPVVPEVHDSPPVEPVAEDAAPVIVEAAEPAANERALADANPVVDAPEPVAVESPPGEDEWVEVWRPAPRRRPQPAPRPRVGENGAKTAPPRYGRDWRNRSGRDAVAAAGPETSSLDPILAPAIAAVDAPATSERPQEARRHEGGAGRRGRNPRPFKGPRVEEGRLDATRPPKEPSIVTPRKEARPATIDMDSPFAKLLALKPLLERRDKRT